MCLLSLIYLFLVGAPYKIIKGYFVKVSQCAKYMRRYHPLAAFVIGIRSLRHIDCLADLCLC